MLTAFVILFRELPSPDSLSQICPAALDYLGQADAFHFMMRSVSRELCFW